MKPSQPRTLLVIVVLLLLGGGAVGYWILLSPGSILVRWARTAFPSQALIPGSDRFFQWATEIKCGATVQVNRWLS